MRATGATMIAVLAAVLGGPLVAASFSGPTPIGADCHTSTLDDGRANWLPDDYALTRIARYGTTDEQAIGSFGGLGHRDGVLYLFDQSVPEVVALSADSLLPMRRFGRRGDGPGEFRGAARPFPLGRYVDFGFLAAGPRSVAVYDGSGIELFDLGGVFMRRYLEGVPASRVFGFRYVGLSDPDGRILFAVDRPGTGSDPGRRLQTLVFDSGDRSNPPPLGVAPRILWQLPLTDPPTTGRGPVVPSLQARPLWTVWGHCVFASDGASDDLWVFNIDTGVAKRHELPNWPLTPTSESTGARFRGLPGSGATPTARIRWEDLVVDPSGAAWVRQWSSQAEDEARVAVVAAVSTTVRATCDDRAYHPSHG